MNGLTLSMMSFGLAPIPPLPEVRPAVHRIPKTRQKRKPPVIVKRAEPKTNCACGKGLFSARHIYCVDCAYKRQLENVKRWEQRNPEKVAARNARVNAKRKLARIA